MQLALTCATEPSPPPSPPSPPSIPLHPSPPMPPTPPLPHIPPVIPPPPPFVSIEFTAFDSEDSFDEAMLASISATIAAEASVDAGSVSTSLFVNEQEQVTLRTRIELPPEKTPAQTVESLTESMGTAAAASQLLSVKVAAPIITWSAPAPTPPAPNPRLSNKPTRSKWLPLLIGLPLGVLCCLFCLCVSYCVILGRKKSPGRLNLQRVEHGGGWVAGPVNSQAGRRDLQVSVYDSRDLLDEVGPRDGELRTPGKNALARARAAATAGTMIKFPMGSVRQPSPPKERHATTAASLSPTRPMPSTLSRPGLERRRSRHSSRAINIPVPGGFAIEFQRAGSSTILLDI